MPKTVRTSDDVRSITGEFTGDVDHNGNYALGLQNIPDLAAKGEGYHFDGVDDGIIVPFDSNLLFATNDFSGIVFLNANESASSVWIIDTRDADDDGWVLLRILNKYRFGINNLDTTVNESEVAGINSVVGFSVDKTDVVRMYAGGKEFTYSAQPNISGETISTSSDCLIGHNISPAGYFNGDISKILLFNLALSETEVKEFSSGAPMSYKYLGASQTNLTSGVLIVRKQYIIDTFVAGDDFTNVGGTNVTGNTFISTGTTPTTWTNGSSLRQIGCVLQ